MSAQEFETQGILIQSAVGDYSFRFDGLWQRPPADPSEWEPWWDALVSTAGLAWANATVVHRPVGELLNAAALQDPSPGIVLVQLVAATGRFADRDEAAELTDAASDPLAEIDGPCQLVAPVVAVVRAGPFEVAQGIEAMRFSEPVNLPSPSGPMVETAFALSADGGPAAIAWHYQLASDAPGGLSVSFLSNAFEFIDEVVVDVARSATSLVVLPRQEPSSHGA